MNLRELIRPSLVATQVAAQDWEDAVRAVGALLVADDAVEPRFVDAMIAVAKEFGPYIVVAPGIALPHARPEDGVKRASIGMITLAQPVEFGNEENDPVSLVLALAAVDNKQHIQGLAELAAILGDDDAVTRLRSAESAEELLKIMWSRSDTPAAGAG
ncbi:MAG: PTS sugar transporter subunit IIA [Anaerolineae bacterium]|nr:PTS sugar transporter subunit IIA [Anaerolineae bacterium]